MRESSFKTELYYKNLQARAIPLEFNLSNCHDVAILIHSTSALNLANAIASYLIQAVVEVIQSRHWNKCIGRR